MPGAIERGKKHLGQPIVEDIEKSDRGVRASRDGHRRQS
jgi:hypothetical protein